MGSVARIEGAVRGGSGDPFSIALIDFDGGSIPTILPVALRGLTRRADGTFLIDPAPSGASVVAVGTEDELRAGRPRARQVVDVRPGETTRIAVDVA
jgi:hypothetical protein